MKRLASITRRLIVTVLLLESAAAVALVAAITVNQRHVQFQAFYASLRGGADELLGATQDANDVDDNVVLDLRDVTLHRGAVYRVTDEKGRVLGSGGELPSMPMAPETFTHAAVGGQSYRFFVHRGIRNVDPGDNGGVPHAITVVYGLPDGHAWHEVMEAVRFFAIATALLLGATALLMVGVVRRSLQPIHDLALEAGRINALDWRFHAPASALQTEELRPLALALQATLGRLQQSFAQQKRFTSDAAHELKTDLAIVKSSFQLLTMKQRTPDEYIRGLARGLQDFTRLEATVAKMLTLARLEQPSAPDERRSIDLQHVLREAVQGGRDFAALRDVRIDLQSAAEITVPLEHDDALLLCGNILMNALQHSPDGGTVCVRAVPAGEHAVLRIRDAGAGIREADRAHLFEPFYRGDASRSRSSGGTGLGLSICKAICDRAGGSIDIRNHAEGGAEVTLRLPLAMPSQDASRV